MRNIPHADLPAVLAMQRCSGSTYSDAVSFQCSGKARVA
jgi:hypothetical protein